MNRLITVLDLGSSKIAAAIAHIGRKGEASLLALENLTSHGIKRGDINDINKAIEDISAIMDKLQRLCKKKARNVSVAIKGLDIRMDISRGMIPLSKISREITKRDVNRCLEISAMTKLPLDRTIIDKIVRNFYIDGEAVNVKNPAGLYGIKLEAEAFVITAQVSKIQNIIKCIDHAGFMLDGIYLSSLASSNSVLNEKEKEEGVLLLDIGDSLTESLVFRDNMLKNFSVMKKGVSNILDNKMYVDKERLDGLLKETFTALKNDFSSIVVTGGGALLDGVIEEAEKILKAPARMGIVKEAGRNLSPQNAIIHTATVGLIDRIAKEHKVNHVHKNPFQRAFRKVLDIYESYF